MLKREPVAGARLATWQLLSLVPAHGLWIDANFKENQLAHMRAGQAVTIVSRSRSPPAEC
jgi:multidrug resistance efflux pump